jgi:hypothetical protein
MRLRQDQRGFVLSGTALLLVLPAMLLTATFLRTVEIGGETTSLQAVADKVANTGYDLERMVRYMDNRGLPINSETLGYLADNYRASTGLLVDLPGVVVYPMWTHVNNNGVDHYAGTRYCRITEVASGVWEYNFEDKDEDEDPPVDYDYNEPRLQVEKIGENIRVTFLGYEGGYSAQVFYDTTLIFAQVGPNNFCSDADNIVIVENVIELSVPISVSDPREAARYSTTVPLA